MPLLSTNYPIIHNAGPGIHNESEITCDGEEILIRRGKTYSGFESAQIDMAEIARRYITTDNITVPVLESGEITFGSLIGNQQGIAFGNGVFVSVSGGIAGVSSDGKSWESFRIPYTLYSIKFIPETGRFIAGANGYVGTSADGKIWQWSSPGSGLFRNVGYGEGYYIAFTTSAAGHHYRSSNGVTWERITTFSSSANSLFGAIYDGSQWNVPVNPSVVFTSPSLSTTFVSNNVSGGWTTNGYAFAKSDSRLMLSYGNGFIASALVGTVSYVSTNTGAGVALTGIGVNGNTVIAVGLSSSIYKSTDGGLTWQRKNFVSGGTGFTGAAYNPDTNTWVVVGNNSASGYSADDGETWNFTQESGVFYGGTYFNGSYYLGMSSGRVAKSTDGQTWTYQTINSGGGQIRGLKTNGSYIIAYGDGGQILKSTDGNTWSRKTPQNATASFYSAGFNGSTWMLAGIGGAVEVSTNDGETWTSRNVPVQSYVINGINFGLGLWVATSQGGAYYSADTGATWIRQTGVAINQYSVFDGTKFVGTSTTLAQVAFSYDGINWQLVTSIPELGIPTSIIWTGDRFIVGGSNGIIQTTDFDTYTFSETPIAVNGIIYNAGQIVVSGNYFVSYTAIVYDDYLEDTKLVRTLHCDNNPQSYVIAYDYNTYYVDNLGEVRLNNDLINNEIVKGQYVTASFYDEQCGRQKTIQVIRNGSELVGIPRSTTARSFQYWFDTSLIDISPGDTLTILVSVGGDGYSVEYKVVGPCHRYILYYVNKYGSLDPLVLRGDVTENNRNNPYEISTAYDRSRPDDFQRKYIHNPIVRGWQCNTGAMSNDQIEKLDNLLSSPKVWIHDIEHKTLYSCLITTGEYSVPKTSTSGKLPDVTFSIEQSQDVLRRN